MIQYDRIYNTPASPSSDSPDIVGPLSRTDNRGGAFRYVEYLATQSIAHNASVTFRPLFAETGSPPDFWVFYFTPNDSGGRATLLEEGQPPALIFGLSQNASVTPGAPMRPRRVCLPARGRAITITAGGAGGNGITLVGAAVWGYDPKDVLQ